jgi:flagellar secretion chaperone FliS
MTTSGSDVYLRDAVLTASPEQLQLMLYDGAIRFTTQGRDALAAKDFEAVYDRFSRAQKIVLEMQGGLRHEVNPSLCSQMSALYNFVYRKLVDASINKDISAADDALNILRHQRETWVLLIDKVRSERAGGNAPARGAPARVAPQSRSEEFESTLSIEC